MRSSELIVAVIGAATGCGRDLRAAAEERGLPVAEWRLYDSLEQIAESVDDESAVQLLENADLEGVDFVFLCGSAEQSAAALARAIAGGGIAIDVRHAFAAREDVAIIVPEVNADTADVVLDTRLAACPVPGAAALATVLNPIERAAVLRRVVVTCLESVSTEGRRGIEELARQTTELLSGLDAAPALWTERIAFNALPQVGDVIATGGTEAEWNIEQQTRRVLDLPDLPIAVNVVRIPVFFGQGFLVNVETEQPLEVEEARVLLRESPGILLHEEQGEAGEPALSQAIGSEATHVARLRADPTAPYGVRFWVAFDSQRKGTVVNAVQIAESLLRQLS